MLYLDLDVVDLVHCNSSGSDINTCTFSRCKSTANRRRHDKMPQLAEYSTFRVYIYNTCDNGLNNEILQPTDLITIF